MEFRYMSPDYGVEDSVSREEAIEALGLVCLVIVYDDGWLGEDDHQVDVLPFDVYDDEGEIVPGEYDYMINYCSSETMPELPEEALGVAEAKLVARSVERSDAAAEWERNRERRELVCRLGSEIE